jgi:serine/threonine protein kinase
VADDDFPFEALRKTRLNNGHYSIVYLVTVEEHILESLGLREPSQYLAESAASHGTATFIVKVLPRNAKKVVAARLDRERRLFTDVQMPAASGREFLTHRPPLPRFLGSSPDDPEMTCSWLALEFLDGKTLREEVETESRGQPLPVEILPRFASALWDTMSALHELGIAHRDISWNNVILRRTGGGVAVDDLVLIDLGLAFHEEVPLYLSDPSITADVGATPGFDPPLFMPASLRSLESERSRDIYQWACNVLAAATGRVEEECTHRNFGSIYWQRFDDERNDADLVQALKIAMLPDSAKRSNEIEGLIRPRLPGPRLDGFIEEAGRNKAELIRLGVDASESAKRVEELNDVVDRLTGDLDTLQADLNRLREEQLEGLADGSNAAAYRGTGALDARHEVAQWRAVVGEQVGLISHLKKRLTLLAEPSEDGAGWLGTDRRAKGDRSDPLAEEDVAALRRQVEMAQMRERDWADCGANLERAKRVIADLQERNEILGTELGRLEVELSRANAHLRDKRGGA